MYMYMYIVHLHVHVCACTLYMYMCVLLYMCMLEVVMQQVCMNVSCMLHVHTCTLYIPKVQRSLYFQHNSCNVHAALQLLCIQQILWVVPHMPGVTGGLYVPRLRVCVVVQVSSGVCSSGDGRWHLPLP